MEGAGARDGCGAAHRLTGRRPSVHASPVLSFPQPVVIEVLGESVDFDERQELNARTLDREWRCVRLFAIQDGSGPVVVMLHGGMANHLAARPSDAFQTEKRLKKWDRGWKVRLIESVNPEWKDLGETLMQMG